LWSWIKDARAEFHEALARASRNEDKQFLTPTRKDTARQSRNQSKNFTQRRQDAKIFRFLIQTNTTKAAECVTAEQKIFSELHTSPT
jgi:hypothetical protein